MGAAYAHPLRRPLLKSENGVMWSEIHRFVLRIITTVWTVTPPSALIGETRALHRCYCGYDVLECMN